MKKSWHIISYKYLGMDPDTYSDFNFFCLLSSIANKYNIEFAIQIYILVFSIEFTKIRKN